MLCFLHGIAFHTTAFSRLVTAWAEEWTRCDYGLVGDPAVD